MSVFKETISGVEYQYPAFKFLEEAFAESMLMLGTVNISKISSFRNSNKYAKQTLDPREGEVTLHNKIHNKEPLFKDNYYKLDNSHAFPKELKIKINDAYIFCCTKYFLSDSLPWAISEGKQRCILITDVEDYISRINDFYHDTLIFKGALECSYKGRDFGVNTAFPYGMSQALLLDNLRAAFFKPINHQQQRELRILWVPKNNQENREFIRSDIDVKDLLIPIIFDKFDESYKPSQNHSVGVRIIKKSGGEDAEFTVSTPNEVFTPVIYNEGGIKLLGFIIPTNKIGSVYVRGCQKGVMILDNRTLVCSIELEDVKQIEFYTKEL